MNPMAATSFLSILSTALLAAATGETSIGWRADGSGHYAGVTPPTVWSDDKDAVKNVAWKIKLPGRSQGSPIIVGQRIFVGSDPAELLCLNLADGAELWRRSCDLPELFGDEKSKQIAADYQRLRGERQRLERELGQAKDDPEKTKKLRTELEGVTEKVRELSAHFPSPPDMAMGETTNSAPTPVCDGKHVYATFGNGVVAAYTLDGERRWVKYVEASTIDFGHASSPALADGKLVIPFNALMALDTATGETTWRVPLGARHASPIITPLGNRHIVVSPAGAVVNLADGKLLLKDNNLSTSECSAFVHDGILYQPHDGHIAAYRLTWDGDDAIKLEKLWSQRIAGGRRTPSAALHKGLLYCVNTDGILDIVDAATGEQLSKSRLDIGSVYSSVTAAGDDLFASSTKGSTVVFAAGAEFREIARNQLEGFGSNPIFLGRRMYVRTHQHLYCIGE
jgi:outer membrane protein assembly factor BamB